VKEETLTYWVLLRQKQTNKETNKKKYLCPVRRRNTGGQ
jgi:hypothetical protein